MKKNPFDKFKMEDESNAISTSDDRYGDIDSKDMSTQKKVRYGQDTRYRKYLAIWVMVIVPAWLAVILVLVCLCASGLWEMTDIQMSTLLATTTANVLGLAHIVLKGLFPNGKDKDNPKE